MPMLMERKKVIKKQRRSMEKDYRKNEPFEARSGI
jgi:hypothetical protein